MAGTYSNGETKVRPGVYFRTGNGGGIELSDALNGVVAIAFKANWGPLNKIVTLHSPYEAEAAFGDDSESGSNVGLLTKIFLGGASEIKAIRVGTGGTNASITLKDNADGGGAEVVTLTAKYAGNRPLSVTIKDSLAMTDMRECIIYSGTRELFKTTFAKGTAEVDALVAAINQNADSVVTAAKVAAGNGTMQAVTQSIFTTAGVSPTITNTDYDAAFSVLEASRWNVLCVDTDDTTAHALVKIFIDRANNAGLMAMAVLGEPTTVAYETRKANCTAFNTENVIYCLNGFKIGDEVCHGHVAAAVAAGLIAYLPANDAPTHKAIPGATEVVGPLTNSQVIECLQAGALVFTTSTSGAVWIEQGINTLTTLTADQDAGWKKIRRAKTRYELITRINQNTESIIGNADNDANGRATIIAIANGVIGQMIAEKKLVSGSISEDAGNPPRGDSAWFILEILDLDSIEKVYLYFKFRFADD